jgi:hypothetical protein
MFVSVLCAPMYVSALLDAIRGRNISFAVTPKGDDGSPDQVATFRKNNLWGALMASVLIASAFLGNEHTAMRAWALLAVVIAFLPMTMWAVGSAAQLVRGKPAAPIGGPAPTDTPLDSPAEAAESTDSDQLVLGGTR